MPIKTECPGCRRTLEVDEAFAGMNARCPVCQTICEVPQDSAVADELPGGWRMRSPEGQIYGPVSREDLEGWVREGRVTNECNVSQDEQPWQSAVEVFPVLGLPTSPRPEVSGGEQRYRYMERHRGGVVLAMGIISWLVGCAAFGVMAWVMGSTDVREMHEGRMDPNGRAATEAGRILGMMSTLLFLAVAVVGVFYLLLQTVGF